MMKTLLLLAIFCFLHIKVNRTYDNFENIIEVPPAIYERLMFYANQIYVIGGSKRNVYSSPITATMLFNNGKHYLVTNEKFTSPPYEYLIGFYILKDI